MVQIPMQEDVNKGTKNIQKWDKGNMPNYQLEKKKRRIQRQKIYVLLQAFCFSKLISCLTALMKVANEFSGRFCLLL